MYPRAGGMRGTATRKTLERKKKRTTGVHARNGGSQSYDARNDLSFLGSSRSGVWMKRRPLETNMLMTARG